MKEATFPLMRDKPSEFEDLLMEEGILLVRKEGKPLAVVVAVSEDSVSTIAQAVSQVRAQMAVANMRSAARAIGLDQLTPEEIQAEISAVRSKP